MGLVGGGHASYTGHRGNARTEVFHDEAVKRNSVFYGVKGQGWFLGIHCFTKYVKLCPGQQRVGARAE
jgi:hypothetical protein